MGGCWQGDRGGGGGDDEDLIRLDSGEGGGGDGRVLARG